MIDLEGFFSTDEVKVGAGVAAGIYITEFGATLLRGYIAKSLNDKNPTIQFIVSALLKGLIGAILYNFGKDNLMVRYMAIGAWTSIILDAIKMFLPSAQSMAMQMMGEVKTYPSTVVIPASAQVENKKK